MQGRRYIRDELVRREWRKESEREREKMFPRFGSPASICRVVDSSCGNKGYRFPPPIVNYRAPFATATAIEIPNEISNLSANNLTIGDE